VIKKELDFIEGELLLIDKEVHWSSFDVVKKIRSAIKQKIQIKKIKVGHGGTLDPLASGLMIVCTGKATKQFAQLIDLDKSYSGTMVLGATTPSFDLETAINQKFDISSISKNQILDTAKSFIGIQFQTPPVYSAIKVEGQRLYIKARKGESPEIAQRQIQIYSFEINTISLPEITFTVRCSKGTYIRSIVSDFGKKLENGAYLKSLRREAIGDFNIEDAWSIEDFLQYLEDL
jgi:tRNA pseudouridine55 synthase